MKKNFITTLISLILTISFLTFPAYAENESDNASIENSNIAVLEILTCTEGYTSLSTGSHEYSQAITEVVQLTPNLGYHVYGVEINGVFQTVEGDTVNVPLEIGKKISLRPVFRGNVVFNIEQSQGGKLSPEGTVYVGTGKHLDVFAIPDDGYICTGIYINDVPLDIVKEGNKYKGTFKAPREKEYTVYATFEPVATHTVTLVKNEGGIVLPFNEEGKAFVLSGDDAQFQARPDEGYGIKSITVNGKAVTWSADGVFTAPAVKEDFEVSVEFIQMESIPVHITTIGKGNITPATKAYLNTTLTLDIMPDDGFELVTVKVNGALTALTKTGKLEISVDENLAAVGEINIEAVFDVIAEKYIIRTVVQNSTGGIITAEGYTIENMRTEVRKGGSITLTFTPDMNYVIEKVKIDGVEVQLTETNTFTLSNVTASHGIIAYFTPDLSSGDDYFQIMVSSGEGGVVSPTSQQLVKPGEKLAVSFIPDDGFEVDYILVDGIKTEFENNTYTFEDVISDHTLEVFFKKTSAPSGDVNWSEDIIKIDISSSTIVQKEIFEQIKNHASNKNIHFIGSDYFWFFPAGIEYPASDIDFGIEIGKDKVSKDIIDSLENKMLENQLQGFDYEIIKTKSPEFDQGVTLNLSLGSDYMGKELDYLYYDAKTGKFSSVIGTMKENSLLDASYPNKITVSSEGKVSLPYNGNEYIILVVSSTSKFKLEIIVGENGSASPRGTSMVLINTTQTIQITPDPGYKVSEIIVNGASAFNEYIGKDTAFSITLGKINSDYTVEIKFESANTDVSQNTSNGEPLEGGLKPWAVALIIIGIAIACGVGLFLYKWNEEKDIVD